MVRRGQESVLLRRVGLEGFKGVYRDIMMCQDEGPNIHSTFWLEGVGGVDGPTINAYDPRC